MARRRAARPAMPLLFARREAAGFDLFDRPSGRRRADVLRVAADEPDGQLDAEADRDHEPSRDPLHGRDPRLLPAGVEPAVEAAADDAAQTGAGVRTRRRAGNAEPGGPGLQGPGQHRNLVSRPSPD